MEFSINLQNFSGHVDEIDEILHKEKYLLKIIENMAHQCSASEDYSMQLVGKSLFKDVETMEIQVTKIKTLKNALLEITQIYSNLDDSIILEQEKRIIKREYVQKGTISNPVKISDEDGNSIKFVF